MSAVAVLTNIVVEPGRRQRSTSPQGDLGGCTSHHEWTQDGAARKLLQDDVCDWVEGGCLWEAIDCGGLRCNCSGVFE